MYNVMKYLKNYFFNFKEYGEYSILNNTIEVRGNYLTGQYIMIKDSILNDGVYKIAKVENNIITLEEELNTELFTGYICSLSVPNEFVTLCEEIKKFNEKHVKTNIVSESYPMGYSYSKSTSTNGKPTTWEQVFSSELYSYRKIYDDFRRCKSI